MFRGHFFFGKLYMPWASSRLISVDNPVFQVGKSFIKKNFFHLAIAVYFAY